MVDTQVRKVALITGASRGIGRETARQLAQLGIHVIVCTRSQTAVDEVVAELRNDGHRADGIVLDVAVAHDRLAAAAAIHKQHGKLDILVNNAGTWLESEDASHPVAANVSTLDEPTLRSIFEVNFFGTVALTQTLLPLILESPAGRIVNVSSILGSHDNALGLRVRRRSQQTVRIRRVEDRTQRIYGSSCPRAARDRRQG